MTCILSSSLKMIKLLYICFFDAFMNYCPFFREPLITNIMWRNLLIQVHVFCLFLCDQYYVTVEGISVHKLSFSCLSC